jgi:hypothetical protein
MEGALLLSSHRRGMILVFFSRTDDIAVITFLVHGSVGFASWDTRIDRGAILT